MSVTLSNLTVSRVSAGSSAVVPPSGDPYWSSVSLLTETTSVNNQNNNAFLDSSINAYAVTTSGTVAQGYYSPFSSGGGSMYFDGTAGNYLSTSSAVSTSMNPSDFTAEAWVYTELVNSVPHSILGNFGTGTDNNYWGLGIGGNNKFLFQLRDNASEGLLYSTTTPSVNTWYHVAVTRTKSTNECKLYVNGVLEATATINKAITARSTLIGAALYTGYEAYWKGYISNVAVTTSLKYTGNFTPSTTPLTAVTGTQLLLSATNAGIYDAAKKNDLFTKGDAQVSTAQKKFGTTSMKFDGTGDYLYAQPSTGFTFGTGDFTIEGWVYITATTPTASGIFQQGVTPFPASTTNSVAFATATAGQVWQIYAKNTNTNSTATWTTGTWYHYAVVRSSSTTKLYINGVSVISVAADTTNYTGTYMGLGAIFGSTPYNLNGYMQDFRVTKGVARYTTNFTPPTSAFPTS